MKKIIALFIACFVCLIPLSAKQKYFQIKGPENSYNQIRIVNETSYGNFKCRLVLLKERSNGTLKKRGYYGTYELKGYGDIDTCTSSIKRGHFIGIEMEKNFPCEVEFEVEYKDLPFFDIIIIHLYDGDKKSKSIEFEDDFLDEEIEPIGIETHGEKITADDKKIETEESEVVATKNDESDSTATEDEDDESIEEVNKENESEEIEDGVEVEI